MIQDEKLMMAVLKKYGLYNKREEYIDLCYIGYTKALNTFDEKKSTFPNYAYRCMENEIMKELRRETAQKRPQNEISIEEYNYTPEDLKSLTEAENGKIESVLIQDETKKELYEAIWQLNERERDIFTNLWKLRTINLSRKQLADKYGLSQTQITNINNKAFRKIKEIMNNGY